MKTRLSKAQAAYENALENVSDLHVKISDGNTKLGAIPSVSLIPVMDCGNCAICAKSCYDLRNDFIYKEVIKTRAINSAIYHEDPERFFKEIDGYLDYRFPRAFRFHIGGDIQDKWYLDKMCEIARKHKDTKFLAFTKMFDVCNEYLDEGNVIPENMHILFSGWLGLKMDNRHGFPEAHPIFESGTSSTGRDTSVYRKLHRVSEGRQTMLVYRKRSGGRIPCTLAKILVRNDGVLCLTN